MEIKVIVKEGLLKGAYLIVITQCLSLWDIEEIIIDVLTSLQAKGILATSGGVFQEDGLCQFGLLLSTEDSQPDYKETIAEVINAVLQAKRIIDKGLRPGLLKRGLN